jgi:hypothetical protein
MTHGLGYKICYDCTSYHGICEKAGCLFSGIYCNEKT